MGFEGSPNKINLRPGYMQTRHGVLGDASWTRGKVSKTRMRLVRSRCQRIPAPSSSTPRGKMAATHSFRHRSRTRLGASSPRKVDGTGEEDLWYVPAGFSQGPVSESRPRRNSSSSHSSRSRSQTLSSRSQTDTAVPSCLSGRAFWTASGDT